MGIMGIITLTRLTATVFCKHTGHEYERSVKKAGKVIQESYSKSQSLGGYCKKLKHLWFCFI